MADHSADPALLERIREAVEHNDLHTIEMAVTDTVGHLRGKRVPAQRFIDRVSSSGVHIADAIYIFDVLCEITDSSFINMGTGFLDTHLTADLSTFRVLGHRPGYGIVMCDSYDEHRNLHPLAPRKILQEQIDRAGNLGLEPVVATELEAYLLTPEWEPIQSHIQYSSLTDQHDVEVILAEMRSALIGCGVPVESSNAEYGPGQIEINVSHGDAMVVAYNTVLLKAVVREVAERHGLRASFMPKLWDEPSGNGLHVHSSLDRDGQNQFANSIEAPNALMSQWTAGLLRHAQSLTVLGIPFANGYRRLAPYSFAPTHVHWGLDNRSVLARCLVDQGPGNRVEYRAADASANPYILLAGLLAAGLDGVENELELMPMADGDMYDDPGGHTALPTSAADAITAYEGSALAGALGDDFSTNYLELARHDLAAAEAAGIIESEGVTEPERQRYREFA
ncbi:MAG: glutamine synthetase [Actinomycetia bacterium]|nr:glutamine synthetase [Actinomycetes bacterium]